MLPQHSTFLPIFYLQYGCFHLYGLCKWIEAQRSLSCLCSGRALQYAQQMSEELCSSGEPLIPTISHVRLVPFLARCRANIAKGAQLPWAIMDLVVMHLSLNHATLPRVHVFLSNLQTGLLVTRLTTSAVNSNSKGSKRSPDADESLPLSGTDEREHSSRWKWRSGPKSNGSRSRGRVLKLLRSNHSDNNKEGSISESPLRLQPEHGIELSTQIYADGDSTASGSGKNHNKDDIYQQSIPIERPSRSNSGRINGSAPKTNSQQITINVHRTVETKVEFPSQHRKSLAR